MPLIEIDTNEGQEIIDFDDVVRIKQKDDKVADPYTEITLKSTGDVIKIEEPYDDFLARITSKHYYKTIIRSPIKKQALIDKAKEWEDAAAKWRHGDQEDFNL